MQAYHEHNSNGWHEHIKRVVDMVGALVLMALLWPVVVLAAAWIKILDPGPVIYRQWRVGQRGWLFQIYKLRTMRLNAEHGGAARLAVPGDPRILPGCRWMRKAHIDELPQLVNVLRGQMSLVGPRPERPDVLEALRADLPRIDQRLTVPPGLTGLAQVRDGYANDLPGMRRKLALDLAYTRRRSLIRDLSLLAATVRCLWDRAAC